jgi:hypothetical protein
VSLGPVFARHPDVRPEDLEVTTRARAGGLVLKVTHLPTRTTRERTDLRADEFEAALAELAEEVLRAALPR